MILVTGKSGFLGSHISIGKGADWDLLNGVVTGYEISKRKPDIIIHLAAVCGGIKFNQDNPARILADNLRMGINVFEAARKANIRRVITIGSTCAYPANLLPPFKIDNYRDGYPEPTNGAYGMAKRMLYDIGEAYSKQHGIEHLHIILTNLYGPGDKFNNKDSHVIPALISKFLNPAPVTVWGDGSAKREFIYVEDAARIVEDLAQSKITGIVNVGSGHTCTIKELGTTISNLMGHTAGVVYDISKPNGQIERLLDSQYKGTTSLADGLAKTIAWYQKKLCLNIGS